MTAACTASAMFYVSLSTKAFRDQGQMSVMLFRACLTPLSRNEFAGVEVLLTRCDGTFRK